MGVAIFLPIGTPSCMTGIILLRYFRALLIAVGEGGFRALNELHSYEAFNGVEVSSEVAGQRLQFLCDFF